jgi:acetolactate synthase I/II/III large subunit
LLVVGIGTRLEVPTGRWGGLPAGLKLARIDIDPVEMRRLRVQVDIVADCAAGTKALTAAVAAREDRARAEAIARSKAETARGPDGAAADVVPRCDPRGAAGRWYPL